MVQRRRTEIGKIDDPNKRRMMFWRRCNGLFKKASNLCELTGARAAVIVFSTKSEVHSFGDPSVKEIIAEYLRRKGDVMPLKGPREWLDWVEKKRDSCATKEDFKSVIVTVLDWVCKQLKDLEDNPSVKAGAGDDSGVGVGRSSKGSNDEKIDSLKKNFEASLPSLFAFDKDYARDVYCDNFLIPPVDSAMSSGSLGVESTPMCSDHEGCGFDPDSFP
ncbi:hypothetical protein NL676_029173 [Syzygium grande]|nr:hypothetical protein NL676_029173 [Syzygium grande]